MAKRRNQTVDDCTGRSGRSWGDCPQGEPQNLRQVHVRQNPQTRFAKAILHLVMEIVNQSRVGGPSMALQACSNTAMKCVDAGGGAGG